MKKHTKIPPVATIYGLCILAVGLLYLWYLFFPLVNDTKILDAKHAENVAQIAIYESYLRKASELKENIVILEAECEKSLKTYALEGKKIVNDIDKAFVTCGIKIDSISMSDEAEVAPQVMSYDDKPLYSLPISLTFSTIPKNLEKLLTYFETDSQGAYYVNSVSAIEQDDKTIEVNLELSAYYYSPQKDVIKSLEPAKPAISAESEMVITDENAEQIANEAVNGIKDTVAKDVNEKINDAASSAISP